MLGKQPKGFQLPVRNGAFDQFLKILPRQVLSPFLEGLRVLPSKFILANSHQPKSADIPFYVCPSQLKSAEYPGGPFVSVFELSHLFFEIKHRHPNPLSSSCAPACHVPWQGRAAAPRAASCPGRRRRAWPGMAEHFRSGREFGFLDNLKCRRSVAQSDQAVEFSRSIAPS